jgi:carboxylesterase
VTAPIVPGCEPFSATGGPHGVLVLHGFTGSPWSVRPLAESLANRGYTVELPLLPGHGTAIEDLVPMRWGDWTRAARAALDELSSRCASVGIVGLSMGGGLAIWLAERTVDLAAVVVVNPLVMPMAKELREGVAQMLAGGVETIDGIGNDLHKEGVEERSYAGLPLAAVGSLMEGLEEVERDLAKVTAPLLVLTSREDHVVPIENSTRLVDEAAGPTEHIWLERSYHVATLDYDADLIEAEAGRFLDAAMGGR